MKRFIWLLTFIPCRILLVILGAIDLYLFATMEDRGVLQNTFLHSTSILAVVAITTIVASIVCAIYGGKIGHDYVEMGRSRHWHYHANKFDDYNDQFRSALYWAGKFACFPIILALILFLASEIYYIV